MSTEENEVRTRLTIAAEAAMGSLRSVHGAAKRLFDQFDRIKSVVVGAAGVGGMFAFGEGVRDADRLYERVARLQAVTGSSVKSIDAMVDVLEKGGIEGEATEQVIIRMTKGLQSAAGAAALTGEQSADLRKKFQLLGVDIKKGPQDMLVQMAGAAAQGKLQVVDLMKLFRMGPEQAAQMMYFLRQGPAEIKKTMDAQASDSSRITAQSLQQYQTMLKAKRLAKDAIGDTFAIVYRTFFPALTKFFQAITAQLERWQPQIQRAMDYLSSHMEQVVKMVERIAVLSAGNKLLSLVTGKGIGGLLERGGGLLKEMAGAKAGAVGGPLGPLEPLRGAISMLLRLRPLVASIGRLAGIGAAVLVAVEGVKLLAADWDGVRSSLMATFQSVVGHVRTIWGYLGPPLMKIAQQAAKAILWTVDKIGWWIDKTLFVIEKLAWVVGKILSVFSSIIGGLTSAASWIASKIGFGADNGEVDMTDSEFYASHTAAQARTFNQLYRQGEVQKILAGQKGVLDAQALARQLSTSNVNIQQDFRGSRIEVKQEFAEGFDAGKVIVAMTDRLATLGERRLTSGFAPLYGTR